MDGPELFEKDGIVASRTGAAQYLASAWAASVEPARRAALECIAAGGGTPWFREHKASLAPDGTAGEEDVSAGEEGE